MTIEMKPAAANATLRFSAILIEVIVFINTNKFKWFTNDSSKEVGFYERE
jgi:hypothetical protein